MKEEWLLEWIKVFEEEVKDGKAGSHKLLREHRDELYKLESKKSKKKSMWT